MIAAGDRRPAAVPAARSAWPARDVGAHQTGRTTGPRGRVVLRLVAFVLPLGVDSFAIAATLAAAGVSAKQRWRITAWFVLFEAGMPLLGLAVGTPSPGRSAGVADYPAAALGHRGVPPQGPLRLSAGLLAALYQEGRPR